ncbi:methionyl-tRNA formyltransferase [Sphingobacteriales bacterium UPWRP_1]|nr:methionyl-tRNA formyltransferase [Sphingobacteriales bacterium TSM_CSM]PSJ73277.1 methionyl-tRNA formyltransferase [Sphingobacteriales bacterium UPWRP_1]
MRIVFMGTPEFAVPSLNILAEAGYDIVAVITAPDKPAGRGQKLSQTAVKQYAIQHNLPILQPEKLRSVQFLEHLQELRADLQVVVAFRMLPAAVFTLPPLGCVNVHASLLPNYRGAAPINWAIMNGEKETGVTTFFIEQEIDAGNLIMQEKTPIGNEETAGQLHDRLMHIGARLLLKTVQSIEAGNCPKIPQPEGNFLKAPKIFTETCRIHWSLPAVQVHNHIRGLSPYPAAFTHYQQQLLKIYRTQLTGIPTMGKAAGSVETDGKSFLHIACADSWIAAQELQLEGRKRLSVAEFLRGYPIVTGSWFN